MTTQNLPANPAPVPGAVAPAAAPASDSSAPTKSHASGSLYVGDLASDVTEAFLFEIFNPVGPVSSIRVCRDSNTHQSLGYAYVNFHNADDAERALDSLNFFSIKGTPCRIMWSHRDPSIRKNTNANIFIKNLAKTIDNKQLYDTFSQFGSILSCKVAVDVTGASKGYGFVHYSDEASAAKAIEEVNGKLIEGKKVVACKHERRQDRQSTGLGKFTNLYIKMIPEDWNLEKFQATFAAFGNITSCVLQSDESGKHKGFGFVNFETHDEALRAIEEGSRISVGEEKTLFVGRFQKKAERIASLSKKFDDLRREKNEKYKNLNLYVKNLDDDVDQAKLRELFEPFGEISSTIVMTDEKGISRGFGFVCFANADDATKALTSMNSKMIGTKPIYVNRAQRKDERRAQLESQFQQTLASQRMQPMPTVYYGPQPGMPMAGPMMYQMMGRRPGMYPPQMRPGYAPGQQQGYPPQQRGRGAGGPRSFPNQRSGAQQQRFRTGGPGRFPAQQVPTPITASQEMTVSALAAASPEVQKQMLGERLFPQVQRIRPDLAGKITGMLLEMEVSDILNVLENEGELVSKVNEAIEVLHSHSSEAQA